MRSIFFFIVVLVLGGCSARVDPTPQVVLPTVKPQVITVAEQYFLQKQGSTVTTVKVEGFKAYELNLNSLIQQKQDQTFEKMFGVPVTIYCGKECVEIYSTGGNDEKFQATQKNFFFIVKLPTGVFAQVRLFPPTIPLKGVCHVIGVHFEGPHLYVLFEDEKGQQHIGMWDTSDDSIVAHDIHPYTDLGWSYNTLEVSPTRWGAIIDQNGVKIYKPDSSFFGRVDVCKANEDSK